MMSPGAWGAGNWHTGAFDPETGMYYAVSHTLRGAHRRRVRRPGRRSHDGVSVAVQSAGAGHPASAWQHVRGLGPQMHGLPIWKPPYGRITAFNMNTGEQVWMAANGDGPRNHPLLKDLNLPPLGIPNRPAPLLTKTLLFIGEGSDAVIGTPQVDWAWGEKFRAYDKATGKVLWEIELPAGTTGGPMTYMSRRQAVHRRAGRRQGSSGRARRPGVADAKSSSGGNR